MKAGAVFFISVTLLLSFSIGAFAQDNYVDKRRKPDEELYTTWTNENMYPQKTVNFLGGYTDYALLSDSTPTGGEVEQLDKIFV